MKQSKRNVALLVLFLWTALWAKRPELFIVRYGDNNRAIKADTTDWEFHRSIKCIPLGRVGELSLGGEVRLQYYDIRNVNFGDVRPGTSDDEQFLQQRYLLHSDLSLGKSFRFFTQLTSNHIAGEHKVVESLDRNDLDFAQLFCDLSFSDVTIRIGRQEISLGNSRMIGVREGPSIRRSFDGARVLYKTKGVILDLFYLYPVSIDSGLFNDEQTFDDDIFGAYLTLGVPRKRGAELYCFGVLFDSSSLGYSTGDEERYSLGGRLFIRDRAKEFNLESTVQFGQIGDEDIRAFQLCSRAGYHFRKKRLKPAIILQADIHSGDSEKGDGKHNTFRPISSTPIVSSPLSFGAANVVALRPEFSICPLKKLSLLTTYTTVWRYAEADYIYNAGLTRPLRREFRPSAEKHYMQAVEGEITYRFNKHFQCTGRAAFAFPGSYTEETGDGETIKAGQLTVQYKF